MNATWLIVPLTSLLAFAVPTPSPDANAVSRTTLDEDESDPRDLVSHVKIDLARAIELALEARSGHAVEVDLEGELDDESGEEAEEHGDEADEDEEGSSIVYTVAIVHGDDLYEVEVDAISGKVLEIEEDDDEDEVAAYRNVLRHAELSLTQLVQHAQGVVKGHPVHAELEMEGKHPICDVAIANGRYLIDVELEARAGHVLELELASLDEDEDEGHHHGKGGHGNEEDDDEDEGEGDEDGI